MILFCYTFSNDCSSSISDASDSILDFCSGSRVTPPCSFSLSCCICVSFFFKFLIRFVASWGLLAAAESLTASPATPAGAQINSTHHDILVRMSFDQAPIDRQQEEGRIVIGCIVYLKPVLYSPADFGPLNFRPAALLKGSLQDFDLYCTRYELRYRCLRQRIRSRGEISIVDCFESAQSELFKIQLETQISPSCTLLFACPLLCTAPILPLAGSVPAVSSPLDFPFPLFLEFFVLGASGASAPGTKVRPLAPPNLLLGFCSELRLKCPPEVDGPAEFTINTDIL